MDLKAAYQILDVPFKSPLSLAGKAYKKLALKYHPDKCKDSNQQEQFLQLHKAFEYIKKYGPKEAASPTASQPSQQQPEPNEFDILLTLEEIFTGVTRKKVIPIKVVDVDGTERRVFKQLDVTVKPGSLAGSRILVEREGDCLYGQIPANVIFTVREMSHSCFKRNRFDIEYIATMTADEACNRQVTVPSLDGQWLQRILDQVITANTVERIPGKGLPILNGNGKRGDLVIKFKILYEKDMHQDTSMDDSIYLTAEESPYGSIDEVMEISPNTDSQLQQSGEQLPANHCDISLSLEEIYRGTVKKQEIICQFTTFNGEVNQYVKEQVVIIKPGSIEGTQIVHPFEGDQTVGKAPANVVFTIREESHGAFQRIGHDIEYGAKITASEAICGAILMIPLLDGSLFEYNIQTPVKQGDRQKIESLGLPILNEDGQFGDLWVEFDVI